MKNEIIHDGLNPHDIKTGRNRVEYGTIKTSDGILIDLVQLAYLQQGGTPTQTWYEAAGEDRATGDDYKIYWEITQSDTEDESEACDWDEFEVNKL
jgi:hypothetical protein